MYYGKEERVFYERRRIKELREEKKEYIMGRRRKGCEYIMGGRREYMRKREGESRLRGGSRIERKGRMCCIVKCRVGSLPEYYLFIWKL